MVKAAQKPRLSTSSTVSSLLWSTMTRSGGRLLVVADFTDRHDTFLEQETRQDFHDLFGEALVVGLFAVQADRAVVADAELRGAEAFPADQRGKIIDIGADGSARLANPEGGLDDRNNAGRRHRLVVGRRARQHVDMRINIGHGTPPSAWRKVLRGERIPTDIACADRRGKGRVVAERRCGFGV